MQKVKTPTALFELQKWFSKVITRPIDQESRCSERAPSGALLSDEAPLFIKPSRTLKPHERVNLYNQQYYWRLLNALQDNFPLLVRLFGYVDFNNLIAIPFLTSQPVESWSLAALGRELPNYLHSHYNEPDRPLILDAAELDAAYCRGFVQEKVPPLSACDIQSEEELLTKKLFLQPHLFIKSYDYALLPFRDALLQEKPEHWIENSFPELKKERCCILLFRNSHNFIEWQEISEEESHLLSLFKKGSSLEAACEKLPDSLAPKIGEWFQSFGALGLFTTKMSKLWL